MDLPGGFKRSQARLMCEAGADLDDLALAYMLAEQCLPGPVTAAIVPLPAQGEVPAAIDPMPARVHVPKHAAVVNVPAKALLYHPGA